MTARLEGQNFIDTLKKCECFCPKAHLCETDFHVVMLYFDSFHSWFPEEGTTTQVHVLSEFVWVFFPFQGLFAKLLMADILAKKNFLNHAVCPADYNSQGDLRYSTSSDGFYDEQTL